VVTGGASGLGEATARLLVREGGRVVVADLHGDRAEHVATSLGGAAVAVACDVADETQVAEAVDTAVFRYGRLDGCFANAGIVGVVGPIAETPMEAWDRTMAVLLRGAFLTVKHAARVLQAQGEGGAIVCTSSIAGIRGGLGPHAYTVAKTGVIGLARSAAAELARHGIRVNALCPGSIPTSMTAHVMAGDPEAVGTVERALGGRMPLGRAGAPDDIAEAVLYLLADSGRHVTGQAHVVDGGEATFTPMGDVWGTTRIVEARPPS
jgi:NAD(P)-dependent dehydrogenase (short-subunit alcohol dehydrogenase family)